MRNFKTINRAVQYIKGNIIEIGCWEGKSTYHIANSCYPETLICNDAWLGNTAESNLTGNIHPTEIIVKTEMFMVVFRKYNNLTKEIIKLLKEIVWNG